MSKKLYEESDVQAIANAIRTKNGLTDTYTISQMAAAISAIETGGGGLPSGWAMGEFTPAENTTGANVEITHGLGKIPNHIFIYTTATELKSTCIRSVCYSLLGETEYPELPAPYNWQPDDEFVRGVSDTVNVMTYANLMPGGTDYTTNRETFFLPNVTNRYYAGGVTYKWIAIRVEDL